MTKEIYVVAYEGDERQHVLDYAAAQAARSGAQAASVPDLRRSGDGGVRLDPASAEAAARGAAARLFASYGVDGTTTSVAVAGDRVSVSVSIVDGSITVTGTGTVRAERAP